MNYYLTEYQWIPYRKIPNPSETLLIADSMMNFHLGYILADTGYYDFRHMNNFNINYYDGSVRSTDLKITPTAMNDLPWDSNLDGK